MRIGALIPIRMTSERLPGKALKDLCGRPVVQHLLDRVFASRHLQREDVVVCTTPERANDALAESVTKAGARVFRGSEDDIIDRFYQAARHFGFDAFAQIDGDDPCSDTSYMDRCLEALLAAPELDIVVCEGLPLGLATKAIRMSALQKVWQHHLTEHNDTGFIYFFTKTGLCKKMVLRADPGHANAEARLTLDYEEDLSFFRELFERLYRPGRVFGVEEIVRLLASEPELVKINAGLAERYWARTKELAVLEYRDTDGGKKRIEV